MTRPLTHLMVLTVCFAQIPALSAGEFETLFDGSNLEGWDHKGNWKVEDGVITREGRGGSLVYKAKKVPNDFELVFEWKVAEGSNSGIYYRPTQYEYQILDNEKHADGKNPRTSAASLYFCMPPSHDNTNKPGSWNQGRIICKGTVIQHWLNGEKVVGFDYTDPKYAAEVKMLRQRGGNLEARGAFLSLQDHGDPVWYRNIKMRELGPDDQLDRTPVTPAELTAEQKEAEAAKLARIVEGRRRAQQKAQEKKEQK